MQTVVAPCSHQCQPIPHGPLSREDRSTVNGSSSTYQMRQLPGPEYFADVDGMDSRLTLRRFLEIHPTFSARVIHVIEGVYSEVVQ